MPLPTLRLPPHGSQRTARGETWFGYSFVPGDLHPLPSASSPGAPDPRRCLHWRHKAAVRSPRRVGPIPRSGSSPQPNTACASCGEYPEQPSPPGRSCSLISVSSSFPSVTTMSRKSSVMQLLQFVPKALTSDTPEVMRLAIDPHENLIQMPIGPNRFHQNLTSRGRCRCHVRTADPRPAAATARIADIHHHREADPEPVNDFETVTIAIY